MLDYHLHLWPHHRARDAAAARAAGAYCERAAGGRGGRAGADRAPLPLPPGRGRCSGGFWDDERVPPALAESMADYWEFHATARPRRLRRVRPGGQGGRPARSSSASRSTTTGAAWTRWPACSTGYPFDVLLGSVHWLGAWRFDDLDDPVSMAEWSARQVDDCWDAYTDGPRGAGGVSGACDVLAHPDLIKVAGHVPDAPGRVVGPHGRGGRVVGHGGRAVLGRLAQAGGRAVPGPAAAGAVRRRAACRSPRRRTPTASSTWPTGPTTCGPLLGRGRGRPAPGLPAPPVRRRRSPVCASPAGAEGEA